MFEMREIIGFILGCVGFAFIIVCMILLWRATK